MRIKRFNAQIINKLCEKFDEIYGLWFGVWNFPTSTLIRQDQWPGSKMTSINRMEFQCFRKP